MEWPNIVISFLAFQFNRSNGKSDEEADLWIAYCAFHLGDYKKAMEVRNERTQPQSERKIHAVRKFGVKLASPFTHRKREQFC